jgi:hypothetical protein
MVSLTNVAAAGRAGSDAGGASENSVVEVNYAPTKPTSTNDARQNATQLLAGLPNNRNEGGSVAPFRRSNILQLTNPSQPAKVLEFKTVPKPELRIVKSVAPNAKIESFVETGVLRGAYVTESGQRRFVATSIDPRFDSIQLAESLFGEVGSNSNSLNRQILPGYSGRQLVSLLKKSREYDQVGTGVGDTLSANGRSSGNDGNLDDRRISAFNKDKKAFEDAIIRLVNQGGGSAEGETTQSAQSQNNFQNNIGTTIQNGISNFGRGVQNIQRTLNGENNFQPSTDTRFNSASTAYNPSKRTGDGGTDATRRGNGNTDAVNRGIGTAPSTQTPHDAILRGIPGAGPGTVNYPPVVPRQIPNTSGPYTDLNKPPLTPAQEKERDRKTIADQDRIRDQLAAGRNYGPDPFSPEEQAKRDRGNGGFNIPETGDGFGAPASTSRALAQKPVPAPPALNVIGNSKPGEQSKIPETNVIKDRDNRDIANYRKGEVTPKELASVNPSGFRGEAIGNLNKITKSLTPADIQKILKSPVNTPLNSSQIKALNNGYNSSATNLGKGDVLIATSIRNSNNQYVSVKLHPDKKGAIAEAKPQGGAEGALSSGDFHKIKDLVLPYRTKATTVDNIGDQVAQNIDKIKKAKTDTNHQCIMVADAVAYTNGRNATITTQGEVRAIKKVGEQWVPDVDAITVVKIETRTTNSITPNKFNMVLANGQPASDTYTAKNRTSGEYITRSGVGHRTKAEMTATITPLRRNDFLSGERVSTFDRNGNMVDVNLNPSMFNLNTSRLINSTTDTRVRGYCVRGEGKIEAQSYSDTEFNSSFTRRDNDRNIILNGSSVSGSNTNPGPSPGFKWPK